MICADLYLREWKASDVNLALLYEAPQLLLAKERYYAGERDATEKAILLLRRWVARYCGDRAMQNALALGRGSGFRLAKIAMRVLTYRLDHPDLTRAEEAEAIGQELGIWLDQSAHRRAVDTMLSSLERYGPDLFVDLAWKTPEKWQQYEAKYGILPVPSPASQLRLDGEKCGLGCEIVDTTRVSPPPSPTTDS
jgi:hypothetical protein